MNPYEEGPTIHFTGYAHRTSSFTVTCDRCKREVPREHLAYNCVQCADFDICANCAAEGLYCDNDTHDWVKFKVDEYQRSYIGPTLTTSGGKILQPGSRPYPTIFQPSKNHEEPGLQFLAVHRYINKFNRRQILIYTDGACSHNGQDNPRAGCAFVFRQSAYCEEAKLLFAGTITFPLEVEGPTGQYYKHTSNRAELRSVIAALQYRDWSEDCNRSWRSVVIATDSQYVAINATERVEKWENSGWVLADRSPVKNQDLWVLFLNEFRRLQKGGVNVSFWRIPRELNERADKFAKEAAMGQAGRGTFHRIVGTGPTSVEFKPLKKD